jgi:hypothetical protein
LTGHSHDYKRNGTSTLFAAFEVATGKVTAAHKTRRRRIEFVASICSLSVHEGDGIFRSASMHNAPAAVVELRRKQPLMRPSGLARLATTKESFQLLDANTNSQSTRNGEPLFSFEHCDLLKWLEES